MIMVTQTGTKLCFKRVLNHTQNRLYEDTTGKKKIKEKSTIKQTKLIAHQMLATTQLI